MIAGIIIGFIAGGICGVFSTALIAAKKVRSL